MKENGKTQKSKPKAKSAARVKTGTAKGKAAGVGPCDEAKSLREIESAAKKISLCIEESAKTWREIASAAKTTAARVESVRRTLWRMSEVRDYVGKGAQGKPAPSQDKPDAETANGEK